MSKFVLLLFLISFLSACESAREGFKLKKNNSDEFLVEKKNPLVMPPNYKDLPKPKDFGSDVSDDKGDEFEKIISSNKSSNTKSKTKKTNIEQSVFEKIN